MKKTLLTLVVAFAAAPFSMLAGTPISATQLPKAAQTFLSSHFKGDAVVKAEQDMGKRGTEYEIKLSSGAEIDFNSDGSWKKIEAAYGSTVPSAVVPKGIASYVATNFPGVGIKEIEQKRGGYEVDLTNGSELKLTEEGKPFAPRQGQGQGGRQQGGRPGKNK